MATALVAQPAPLKPVFACVYGGVKLGKTTDCLLSFPHAGYLARPGALAPAHWIGFTPKELVVTGIDGATAAIKKTKIGGRRAPGDYPTIIVDDFSMLAEETVAALKEQFKGSKNKYAVWDAVRAKVLDFRSTAESIGMHVVMNAHETPPRVYEGRALRGGPRLPGTMAEDFPAACGIVLRAIPGERLAQNLTWPGRYLCDSNQDPGWVTGDRYGIAYHGCPMNLGELMRASGYIIERFPGVDEGAIEKAARYLQDKLPLAATNDERLAVVREIRAAFRAKGLSDMVIRWSLRDAVDRTLIRLARAERYWEYTGG